MTYDLLTTVTEFGIGHRRGFFPFGPGGCHILCMEEGAYNSGLTLPSYYMRRVRPFPRSLQLEVIIANNNTGSNRWTMRRRTIKWFWENSSATQYIISWSANNLEGSQRILCWLIVCTPSCHNVLLVFPIDRQLTATLRTSRRGVCPLPFRQLTWCWNWKSSMTVQL